MTEPGAALLKKFRLLTGMLNFMAGMVVFGCSTCAPKYDSSHASLYVSFSRHTASLTTLGSAE